MNCLKHKAFFTDKVFYYTLAPIAAVSLAVILALISVLTWKSIPILRREGLSFITTSSWNPSPSNPSLEFYGILAPLLGTIYTSLIALTLATPASLAIAVLSTEYAPERVKGFLEALTDLMVGIPTVVYGLWGAYVLAPLLMKYVMQPLYKHFSFIPLFSKPPVTGESILTAGVILAVMITPFMTGLIRESMNMIPWSLREAVASLGATRFECIRVLTGLLKPAIIAAALLGLGRAAGETIAVSLTIGNCYGISICMFTPSYTISSLIANQFPNAGFYHYMSSALYAAGLVMLLISIALSIAGVKLLCKWRCMVHG